jgi:hypothetical protein
VYQTFPLKPSRRQQEEHLENQSTYVKLEIPYARHYKPRLVYFFTPFFTAVYTVERLDSTTDNLCTKQGNSSIFEPKIRGL